MPTTYELWKLAGSRAGVGGRQHTFALASERISQYASGALNFWGAVTNGWVWTPQSAVTTLEPKHTVRPPSARQQRGKHRAEP